MAVRTSWDPSLDGPPRALVVDIDGTLVDSVYHHAMVWHSAFRRFGLTIPLWRLHRHVGMGGDRLVPAVAGREVDEADGDALRSAHDELFAAVIEDVPPLPGAAEFVRGLAGDGVEIVLCSSARREDVDHYVRLLGIEDDLRGTVSSDDADTSKPAPDLLEAALDLLGHRDAVTVGDAVWDCLASARAGLPSVAVLTGGFSREELRGSGARFVGRDLETVAGWLRRPVETADGGAVEAAVLGRLQGEVASDPGIAEDPDRFAVTVDRLVAEVVRDPERRESAAVRLRAMRDSLLQAGS